MLQFLLFANQYDVVLCAPLHRGRSANFLSSRSEVEEAI